MAFARAELLGPLGIATNHALELTVNHWPVTQAELETFEQATVAWPRDPQGYNFGGGGLKLPARDLAKLGYLYLNGGRWDGTQVVPADYVRASTQPQSDPGIGDYGYQWWVTDDYGYDTFRAQGYGGQLIYVIPELDLVVVITSDPNQERTTPETWSGRRSSLPSPARRPQTLVSPMFDTQLLVGCRVVPAFKVDQQ
jgi:CubicO group peptidase (beta-lactamase class C family)